MEALRAVPFWLGLETLTTQVSLLSDQPMPKKAFGPRKCAKESGPLSPSRRSHVKLSIVLVGLLLATAASVFLTQIVTMRSAFCSGARWPVKTLSDNRAGRLNRVPRTTTVLKLRMATPPGVATSTPRLVGFETDVVTVSVDLVNGKLVHDGDLQLTVKQPGLLGRTMIAELPAANCLHHGTSTADRVAITTARAQITSACGAFDGKKRALHGSAVLTGVQFHDTPHAGDDQADNARGAAPNEVEIHPVLSVTGLLCGRRAS